MKTAVAGMQEPRYSTGCSVLPGKEVLVALVCRQSKDAIARGRRPGRADRGPARNQRSVGQGYAISETGSPFLKINNLGEVEDCLWIPGQDAVFGYRLRDDNHAQSQCQAGSGGGRRPDLGRVFSGLKMLRLAVANGSPAWVRTLPACSSSVEGSCVSRVRSRPGMLEACVRRVSANH